MSDILSDPPRTWPGACPVSTPRGRSERPLLGGVGAPHRGSGASL